MGEHLSDEHVAAWLEHRLGPEALSAAEAHLDACQSCRELVSEAAEQLASPEGQRIGRYEVLGALGEGATGVVYLALDPELQRRVAVKLLRAAGTEVEHARTQLLAEARALARLSHPNVVTVHEVGSDGGRVFLVMEYVKGVTLRAFWARHPSAWEDQVRVLLDAARGLSAAHDAGIVHRDFKPENVLIGEDGRARVSDFGLAAELGAFDPGKLVGTPAYMSPEQLRGEGADARSDQFSLCVVLFEALHGARPFQGRSVSELEAAIRRGPPTLRPLSKPPRRVLRALHRGLAWDPAARFPSLSDLLAVLEPPRRARVSLVLGGLVSVLVALGAFALSLPPRCESRPSLAERVRWQVRAPALLAALRGTGVPYAATSFSAFRRRVEQLISEWDASDLEVCRLRDGAARRAREVCLEQRARSLRTTLTALEAPSALAATYLVQAAYDLPPGRSCDRLARVESVAQLPPPGPLATEVEHTRDALGRARALNELGEAQRAMEVMPPLRLHAQRLGYHPLIAEVLLLDGMLRSELEVGGAEATLESAADEAHRAGYVFLEGSAIARAGRSAAARGAVVQARAAHRAGEEVWLRGGKDAELEIQLARLEAQTAAAAFEPERELVLRRRAAVLARQGLRAGDPFLASILLELADALLERGLWAEADAAAQEASEDDARTLGEEHPWTLIARLRPAESALEQGRAAEAVVTLRGMRLKLVAELGPAHRFVARVDEALARASLAASDVPSALLAVSDAVQIRRAGLPADALPAAQALATQAELLVLSNHSEAAAIALNEAERLTRNAFSQGARRLKAVLAVGQALLDAEQAERAEQLLGAEFVPLLDGNALKDDEQSRSAGLTLLSECALRRDDVRRARDLLRGVAPNSSPRARLVEVELSVRGPKRADALRAAREMLERLPKGPGDVLFGYQLRRWLNAQRAHGQEG